ncbi:site-2 protease family protein [Candidatus Nomurabacteria bacterium]|nr:site-2 protease family protein [Candidatus Nomurabacteria bacterium]USN94760.1 MAG: site-2 protease family protein [Candidatus Nomurabacteria bacterium]
MESIFLIAIIIFSVVIHEVAHGYVAYKLGDMTAYYQGRLTLNPIKHLDMFGSIILPALLVISGTGFLFGWAKPVPYNPNNIRGKKGALFLVSAAGIFVNLTVAVVFALVLKLFAIIGLASIAITYIFSSIIMINIILAVFNLMPIPPLDGSKILASFFGARGEMILYKFEKYSFLLVIAFVIFLWPFISSFVSIIFDFLV